MPEKFDLQPTLVGPRVIVRPVRPDDFEAMFAAASDPQIWAQHPANDRCEPGPFKAYFEGALSSGSAFAFVDATSNKIIGSSRYYGLDTELSEIEIGWTFLARDYWGGDYNAEIKRLMLEHAFKYVATVVFWVGADNIRSRRAMEKIGGVLRDGIYVREVSGEHENVVYEVKKSS